MVFDGEYKFGKKHENAKEYNNEGILIFEGQFYYNERSKGIEYNKESKILFVGEYLYNKKYNGKVKEYYNNGSLAFEGSLLNGEKNGKAKIYSLEGIVEYVEYENGKIKMSRDDVDNYFERPESNYLE